MDENQLAKRVIRAAIEVHRSIGPGLLESAYRQCMAQEMTLEGLPFQTEMPISLEYKGVLVPQAYRVDMLVGGSVILEFKAVERIRQEHRAQLLTYLRWSGCRLGLLINFNGVLVKHGISRVVNCL